MQIKSQLITAVLMLGLATACSKTAEQQPTAETGPQANETAQDADSPGTTTTFEESTPEPQG
jgi:hypothetical protein